MFRSGNYQAALDLLSSLDSAEIKKGTIKTVIAVIKKLLKQPDYNNIDVGIELAQNFDAKERLRITESRYNYIHG